MRDEEIRMHEEDSNVSDEEIGMREEDLNESEEDFGESDGEIGVSEEDSDGSNEEIGMREEDPSESDEDFGESDEEKRCVTKSGAFVTTTEGACRSARSLPFPPKAAVEATSACRWGRESPRTTSRSIATIRGDSPAHAAPQPAPFVHPNAQAACRPRKLQFGYVPTYTRPGPPAAAHPDVASGGTNVPASAHVEGATLRRMRPSPPAPPAPPLAIELFAPPTPPAAEIDADDETWIEGAESTTTPPEPPPPAAPGLQSTP
jgi:hypothetical protein